MISLSAKDLFVTLIDYLDAYYTINNPDAERAVRILRAGVAAAFFRFLLGVSGIAGGAFAAGFFVALRKLRASSIFLEHLYRQNAATKDEELP